MIEPETNYKEIPLEQSTIVPGGGGQVLTDGDFRSSNFKAGSAGWQLDSNGNLEANNGNFRGDITGASGTFTGTVTATALDIPDAATTNSAHIEADGDTFWGATPANFTSNNDNAPAYILKTGTAKFQSVIITGATVSRVQVPVSALNTAGEDLTAADAVCVGDGAGYILVGDVTPVSSAVARDTAWWSQKFTTSDHAISIAAVVLKFTDSIGDPHSFSGAPIYSANIYANSGGKPTGSSLGSMNFTGNTGSPDTATFSSPIAVSPSTDYHIVLQGTLASNRFSIIKSNGAGTGVNTSADSGVNWSAATGPLYYQVVEIDTIAGRIHKTQTNISRDRSNNFVGFALSTVSKNNPIDVSITGVESTLTGLISGSTYFLSDTKGAISTSPGTVTRKIGVSFSASQLIVKHDNV